MAQSPALHLSVWELNGSHWMAVEKLTAGMTLPLTPGHQGIAGRAALARASTCGNIRNVCACVGSVDLLHARKLQGGRLAPPFHG